MPWDGTSLYVADLDARGLPFPVLAKKMKRMGDDLQGPLLQVSFKHMRSHARTLRLGDIAMECVEVLPAFLKNQLKVDLREGDSELRLRLLYDRDGFDANVAQSMVAAYRARDESERAETEAIRIIEQEVLPQWLA